MILPQSPLSRLTLAALATLLSQAGIAHANPTIDASSVAAVSSGTATPGKIGAPGDPYVYSSANASDATGNAWGNGWASIGGSYAVRASSEGIASSEAHAQFGYRFQNLTGVAQHYTLSFYIYGGGVGTNAYYRPLETGEFLTASYAASIKTSLNGGGTWNSAFSSGATITTNATGSTGSRSGNELTGSDDNFADGSYYWSGDYYSVDLGVVAAGDFIDVLAEVETSSASNVGIYSFDGGSCGYGYGYGYGYGNYDCGPQEVFAGQAFASYGDPLNIDGDPQFLNNDNAAVFSAVAASQPQPLPEPAGLALVGLAVGAAGLARRRKRNG